MGFRRDRLTWVAYVLLAWFAFLQATPGLVIPHLRDELHMSYAVGGLHVAAFAAGSTLAGVVSARVETRIGRRRLLWSAAGCMAAGAVGLTVGRVAAATVGSVLVMGVGGGLLLATVQALLADHHGERRAVALTEANVAAAVAYVVLTGALSLAALIGAGWRAAVLASLLVPTVAWWRDRRLAVEAPAPPEKAAGRLPVVVWLATAMLFCTTAAEWCVTSWGSSFVETAADVSSDTAVSLMSAYFAGFVLGRTLGSALTRRHLPPRLLAGALVLAAVGFAVLWPARSPVQAVVGLLLVGTGIGNLFPLGLAVTVGLVPGRSALASGRAVVATALAGLLAPLTVGTLADTTSLTAALAVVPAALALAAVALALVAVASRRARSAEEVSPQADRAARSPDGRRP
ncbi:MFS transporter [Nocardioides sp. CER19]|uniref:MFS transporter n=1 Tax=Nocardioides sp. CER19 TaxID=3038538 RepID=UPI00244933CB|nr:MFS transporter [Nocardioides sp. CER19]MDH2415762.1 MFS transporter [Nocardioides sp. CER19]